MLASIQDFVNFVGRQEAIELSRLDDPEIDTINPVIIQNGLNDAASMIRGHSDTTWELFKPCQLRIARFLLDPYSGREVVTNGYTEARKWLSEDRNKQILWE